MKSFVLEFFIAARFANLAVAASVSIRQPQAQHFTCTLPVAFENTSIMITATDENKQQMLDDAVKLGGIPIGLVIADKQGFGVMDIRARIFPEQPRPSTRSRCSQFGSTISWRRS